MLQKRPGSSTQLSLCHLDPWVWLQSGCLRETLISLVRPALQDISASVIISAPWPPWSSVPTSSSLSLQSSLRVFPGCPSILARASVSAAEGHRDSPTGSLQERSCPVTVPNSRQPNSAMFTRPGPSEAQGRNLPFLLSSQVQESLSSLLCHQLCLHLQG